MDSFRLLKGRLVWSTALLVVFAVVIAGCGSSSDDSSSSSATSGETSEASGSAEVEEAQAYVDEHEKAPTSVGVTEPVAEKPPTGKSVIYLDCGVPVCAVIGEGVKAAGEKLGWSVKSIVSGATPEEVSNAWNQVLQLQPDAVIGAGSPEVLFSKQLAEYKAKGGVYVAGSVLDPVGNGLIAVIAAEPDYEQTAKADVSWIVAHSDGDASTVFYGVPEFPVQAAQQAAFEKEYKKQCPGCELTVEKVPAASIGTKLPEQVVSFLQRKPDTNYIAMGFGDMTVGVPEALNAAGLQDQVKIIAGYSSPGNLQHVAEGGPEEATVAHPDLMSGWLMTDALVRDFTGTKLPQSSYEKLPFQYLTKATVGDPEKPYVGIQNYQEQFEKLWKLGG